MDVFVSYLKFLFMAAIRTAEFVVRNYIIFLGGVYYQKYKHNKEDLDRYKKLYENEANKKETKKK